jgi:threonylcarbamoyladenosine tRNA methylthiotransferase MtaB
MNRPYTQAGYAEMVEGARRAIDGLAVTTDVMIGFPGETSAQFRRTLDFVRHLGPARTHIFTFSRRPGTAAYGMDGSVEASEVRRRYCELEGAALNAAYLFARSFIGRTLKVLVEDRRDERSGLLTGYTDNYIKVLFKGPDALRGHIEDVRIASADPLKTTGVHVGHCGGRS